MPGFMDNYLQNGREEEQNMFDPYSDMNYMGQEHQGMGKAMPMESPGQDPRKKNRWAAYFQQMLGKGGQVDPSAQQYDRDQQMAAMGSGAPGRQQQPSTFRDPLGSIQSNLNSVFDMGDKVSGKLRNMFAGG